MLYNNNTESVVGKKQRYYLRGGQMKSNISTIDCVQSTNTVDTLP